MRAGIDGGATRPSNPSLKQSARAADIPKSQLKPALNRTDFSQTGRLGDVGKRLLPTGSRREFVGKRRLPSIKPSGLVDEELNMLSFLSSFAMSR